MIKAYFSNLSSFMKLMMVLFIIVVCFSLFMFLGVAAALLIFDINPLEASSVLTDVTNPDNLNVLKFLQVVQSIGLFIVPPILIGYLFQQNSRTYLKLTVFPPFILFVLVFITMVSAIPTINFIAELNLRMNLPDFLAPVEEWMKSSEESAKQVTQAFLKTTTARGMLVNFLIIAIIPAFGEELLFRGVFQKIFSDWTRNKHIGILIAAILFSAMHMQFFGFFPRLLMGMMFGYLFVWSGSLWLPIFAHLVNNGFAVVASFYQQKGAIGDDLETIGTSSHGYWYALISVLFVIGGLLLIFRKTN